MCGKFNFHDDALMLNYFQKSLNSCCFSSLVSSFISIKPIKADNAISLRIEESLNSKVGNCIDFENSIFLNEKQIKANRKCSIA